MHPILNCRVQILLKLTVLSGLMMVIGGCAASTTADDFVPKTIAPTANAQRLAGSVNVQASVPQQTSLSSSVFMDVSVYAGLDATKLKAALEKSITQSGVFSQVDQGNADYVLDVWVEKIDDRLEIVGEGFIFDMTSIWRLTRVKDGKVLLCDYAKGHGAARGVGTGAYPPSISAATRDMVQKGLTMLSDRSGGHLSAISKAGLRASMGPVMPEGVGQLVESVERNWSQLRTGLSIEQVEELLGPFRTNGAVVQQHSSKYTQEYTTGQYTVVFINGKLSRWELLGH
jgi:hypothetical protein